MLRSAFEPILLLILDQSFFVSAIPTFLGSLSGSLIRPAALIFSCKGFFPCLPILRRGYKAS